MLDSRWASIDAFAENNRDNILRDITRLVAVPSVEGTPEPGSKLLVNVPKRKNGKGVMTLGVTSRINFHKQISN